MSQAMARADQMSSGYKKYLLALYYLATAKFSLTFAAFGLLLIGLGPLFDAAAPGGYYKFGVHPFDAVAAIFGVVGASFVVFGVTVYLVLLANRKIGEMT